MNHETFKSKWWEFQTRANKVPGLELIEEDVKEATYGNKMLFVLQCIWDWSLEVLTQNVTFLDHWILSKMFGI